jgi:hypothetical protein
VFHLIGKAQARRCLVDSFFNSAQQPPALFYSSRHRGILCLLLAMLASAAWLVWLPPRLGIDPAKMGRDWATSWFFFGFAALAFYNLWPFVGRLRQPAAGLLAGALATIMAIVVWETLLVFIPQDHMVALFSYAQFFLFTIGWFYHNVPFSRLAQPFKGTALSLLSIGLGIWVYQILGPLPQSYIFFIPEFLFLFFDDWPIPALHPWRKGAFWTVLILAGSFLANRLFIWLGAPLDTPRGADLVAVIFAAMLVTYSLDRWPLPAYRQPELGLIKIISTIGLSLLLALVFFKILQLEEYSLSNWVWVCWCFQAIFFWFTRRDEQVKT